MEANDVKYTEGVLDRFIQDLIDLAEGDIDLKTLEIAKMCFIDYLGVAMAGSKLQGSKISKLAISLNDGVNDAPLIGMQMRSSSMSAALINGMNSHFPELDDGDRFAMMHPGVIVFSSLISLREKYNISDILFYKGAVIGYEGCIRLAEALQPDLKKRGYHATAAIGGMGAVLGCGVALGWNLNQIKNAFSAAATQSSGLLKVIKEGSELKPFNAGMAASKAILAILVAEAGFVGPQDVLVGKGGVLSIYSDKFNENVLFKSKGEQLRIQRIYRKPYAACRHCHPAIEGALGLREKVIGNLKDIKSIKVLTYDLGVDGHDHSEIMGVHSAKMSTPFSVAVALVKGNAGLVEFTEETIMDPLISSLCQKVTVEADSKLSKLVPNKRVAEVEIVTQSEIITSRVEYPKGEPENPLNDHEIINKFYSLANFAEIPENISQQIYEMISNNENLDKVFKLL